MRSRPHPRRTKKLGLDLLQPAPMRFMPFSYFCTCWNVRPSAFPSFSWLIASICRRVRTRLPTCLSTEFVAFSPTTPLPRAIRNFPHVSDIGDPQLGVLRCRRFWTGHIRGADADAPICDQEPTRVREELAKEPKALGQMSSLLGASATKPNSSTLAIALKQSCLRAQICLAPPSWG